MKLEEKILKGDIRWEKISSEGDYGQLILGMIAEFQMGNEEKVIEYINTIIEDIFDLKNGRRKVDNCLTIPGSWLSYYLRYFAEVEVITSVMGKVIPRLRLVVVDMFNQFHEYYLEKYEEIDCEIISPSLKYLIFKYNLKFNGEKWI